MHRHPGTVECKRTEKQTDTVEPRACRAYRVNVSRLATSPSFLAVDFVFEVTELGLLPPPCSIVEFSRQKLPVIGVRRQWQTVSRSNQTSDSAECETQIRALCCIGVSTQRLVPWPPNRMLVRDRRVCSFSPFNVAEIV